MRKVAVPITALAVLCAPGALAADEASYVHPILEADTAQGTALGSPWAPHPSYGVSVLGLWESGQGFGARFSLRPSPSAAATWELSADAVARFANESPWYLKGIGGIAVAPPNTVWPPRLRAGAEVGLTAIRSGIGLEAGISAILSFPPARPQEGQVVVSLGVGILFGFGAPSPAPAASCQQALSTERPAQRQQALRGSPGGASVPYQLASYVPASPAVVGVALGAGPLGGDFNTCEGSRGTPQCLQAMSQTEGATSATSATSPPAPGASTSTAVPVQAESAASSTAPGTTPGPSPTRSMGWGVAVGIATSVGAALGFKSDEQRTREAEQDRLMEESARTLEALKREQAQELAAAQGPEAVRRVQPEGSARRLELPVSESSLPRKEPGGTTAPRGDSETRTPLSAPGAPEDRAIAEPDGKPQPPLSFQNPHGQHGKPDHQATVKRLTQLADREFPNAIIETGTSIYKFTRIDRRPDVWAREKLTDKVLKIYEAARMNPDGSLPRREQLKKMEYDRLGIPSHFEPVTP